MLVKILDSRKVSFENSEGKLIEGFRNYFINDFRGQIELKSVFTKDERKVGDEIDVYYSVRNSKYKEYIKRETNEEISEEEINKAIDKKTEEEDLPF